MLTLDELEIGTLQTPHHAKPIHKKKKGIGFGIQEIAKVGIVVFASFLVGNIVTNAGLYGERINERWNGVQQVRIGSTTDSSKVTKTAQEKYLDLLFQTHGVKKTQNVKEEIYAYYKTRTNTLDFQFNTLPPDRRILIPDLGIQAPIKDVEGDIAAKMKDGSFTEELKQGVVHYPTTPDPSEPGTTMIFGHTSNFFRIKSAYNTIFSKIPQLKQGQIIQLIWDGKMYEYEVKEQEIVKPQDVPATYAKKFDANTKRLAIMGCYPVGTRNERVIVFAEPKGTRTTAPNNTLAYVKQ